MVFGKWLCGQADKISTLLNAGNVNVEAYWPGLFAKFLQERSIDDIILNVGAGMLGLVVGGDFVSVFGLDELEFDSVWNLFVIGGGGAAVAVGAPAGGGGAGPAAAAAPVEEKKVCKKKMSSCFVQFGGCGVFL